MCQGALRNGAAHDWVFRVAALPTLVVAVSGKKIEMASKEEAEVCNVLRDLRNGGPLVV